MRIEHQGTIETQPVYQHVGYVSVCFDSYFPAGAKAVPTLPLALMACGIAVALMLGRRSRSLGGGVVAGLVVVGLIGAMAITWASVEPPRAIGEEFYTTLYNLEAATALTDEWEAELGRLPTVEEWTERMADKACRVDGWGQPFRYTADVDEGGIHEWVPPYQIVSDGAATGPGYSHWAIGSEWLGEDGVFGTMDDYSALYIRLKRHPLDPATHPHGREPREVEAEQ